MLERLKILDFTTLLPGPFATLYLADMGAEVLRISAPDRVDLVSELEPKIETTGAAECYLGRNKRTMTLDLKTEEGVDIVEKLIADKGYDIVIEQFRPGVMEKLGLSYDALSAICPNLIYLSLTGYGATGPYRLRAGHDIGYLAKAGLYSHSGRADAIPTPLGTQIADLSGSLNAVIAILAAVEKRNAGHGGSYVDLSMFDCALPWNSLDSYTYLAGGEPPAPEEGLLNGGSLYDLYETKDGKTLAMGALEPKFFSNFANLIGKGAWAEDGATSTEHKEELRAIIRTRTADEWKKLFAIADTCVEVAQTVEEAAEDPQTIARRMVVDVPVGKQCVKQWAHPILVDDERFRVRRVGKKAGTDTPYILAELGYSDEEIGYLVEDGIV